MSMNRREAIRAGLLVGAGAAGALTVVVKDRIFKSTPDPTGKGTVRNLTVLNNIKPQPNEDVLMRMQRELVAAMAKPVE